MNKEQQELMEMLLKSDEPLYEKLAPNEVYLIEKQDNKIIYAVNIQGTVQLKLADLEE
jgi:hypothetical protein